MSAPLSTGSGLTRETILQALGSLSEQLGRQGVTGELCLFGGTVMVLAFTARLSTKDVDALFQPTPLIRDVARRIAEEQNLPADWLNDGVKGFVSARHETTAGNLPQFPHLRLTMPVPEYLLAMKCMAARLSATTGETSDLPDIVFLIRHLRLPSAQAVLEIVMPYYPANRIPVETQYLVEGLFEEGKIGGQRPWLKSPRLPSKVIRLTAAWRTFSTNSTPRQTPLRSAPRPCCSRRNSANSARCRMPTSPPLRKRLGARD